MRYRPSQYFRAAAVVALVVLALTTAAYLYLLVEMPGAAAFMSD